MPLTSSSGTSILDQFKSLHADARNYFAQAVSVSPDSAFTPHPRPDFFSALPGPLQEQGLELSDRVAALAQIVGPAIRRSPLLTEADEREAGYALKGMRAAIRLRRFSHWDATVIHDEGTVLGLSPAGDSQDDTIRPQTAAVYFDRSAASLMDRLELMNPQPSETTDVAPVLTKAIAAGYRPGTAFIMMWMTKGKPDLIDVSNAVKRCFGQFGIVAARSDDIEHEDVITERILDEIKTAEFLFADLTGERPSVYYEVGYAHALGRRVIMFRKVGTAIHFDLAAYNCPEYQNLSELEDKLTKRLEAVTGRIVAKKFESRA
jgi:hypothetical protein